MLGRLKGSSVTSIQGERKNEERVAVVSARSVRDAKRCDAADDRNTHVSPLATTVSPGTGRAAKLIDKLS
jgi:hypothetical protein